MPLKPGRIQPPNMTLREWSRWCLAQIIGPNDISVDNLSAISADMGTLTAGEITAGNISINADDEQILIGSATGPLTGTGIFLGLDGVADYDLRAGDPADEYVHWDGSAGTLVVVGTLSGSVDVDSLDRDIVAGDISADTITGNEIASLSITGKTITADQGTIGGWTLSSTELSNGSLVLDAADETIKVGAATAPTTGTGVFIGKDGADYEFRCGDPSGAFIHWDGSTLIITYADGTVIDDLKPSYVGDSDSNTVVGLDDDNVLLTTPTSYETAYTFTPNMAGAFRCEVMVRKTNGGATASYRIRRNGTTTVDGPTTITQTTFTAADFTDEITISLGGQDVYTVEATADTGSVEFDYIYIRARPDQVTFS